jgi:hypothetical protein
MKRKRLLRLSASAILAAGLCFGIKAYAAGTCSGCTIRSLYVDSDGLVWLGMSSSMTVAGCASAWPDYLIFDPAGTAGTAYLTMAQQALLTGGTVTVSGTNGAGNTPCTLKGINTGVERLNSLQILY